MQCYVGKKSGSEPIVAILGELTHKITRPECSQTLNFLKRLLTAQR